MKILYLSNHLNIGGISSYILSLGRGMKARGHEVFVGSSGGELTERFEREGIRFLAMPIRTKSEANLPKIFISLFKSLEFIKEKDIDIVHSNSRVTSVLGSLIGYFSGKPHVSTCHGFFKKKLSRRIFPCRGRKVIAISPQVREHLIADLGAKDAEIAVIPNGVEQERFRPYSESFKLEAKNRLGLKEGPVVGIIARLSDVKGHAYLLRAMQQVLKEIKGAQLLIVGDGKLKSELVGLTRNLNIEESVFFMNAVDDTSKILPVMDVFAFPSVKEGLGLGLMEAMSCGLPVIGSDVGGIKSLIQDGKNGLLVRPQDPQALSEAIVRLLKDRTGAKALGEEAKAFINENFSLERMVLQTERVYLECVNRSY